MTTPGPNARQVLAWLSMLLLGALILGVSFGPLAATGGTKDLAGPWEVVSIDHEPAFGTIVLPGLFGGQGLSPNAHVVLRKTVEIPDDDVFRAVWLENPQYALRLRWDGREVARTGDPDLAGTANRSDAAILAWVDDEPGLHEIEIEIQGDYGEGGLTGRTLIGPRDSIHAMAKQADTDKLGLSLMLALLGIVQLRVASRAPARHMFFWFGVFACALAVWAFLQTDNAHSLLGSVPAETRMRRLTAGMLGPLGVAFFASFVYGAPRIWEEWYVKFGLLLSLPAVVLPVHTLYRLEQIQDVFLLVFMFWCVAIAADAARRRVPGAAMLVVSAFPPLIVGVVGEFLISHGLTSGSSYLFPAFTLFVAGVSASMSLRFADEAHRHERLLAGSSDAMLSVDARGRVTDVNPAARALLGEAVGRSLMQWAVLDDQALLRGHIARGTTSTDRVEFRFGTDPQATKALESIATPLGDQTTLLVLRDVTKRRQIDKGMLHAARMETIGVLVGGIAHDFNNMLGTLLAHVGFLQASLGGTPHQARLDRMESTIDRASVLTRRLLTVAGGTSSDLGPVQLAPLCRGACELVEPTLPEGVTLQCDGSDDLPPVLGSASDLEQVLVNLLVNARDAVGERGHIQVTIRPYSLSSGAQGAVIVVDDDGPGVPLGKREEIFEPFVTTKAPNKGTGLGLAVSMQILRDHHGRLWVEDRPGGGARFCCALRHVDAGDHPGAPLPENRDVLLVEDEEPLRDSYAAALKGAGYHVTACASGQEAAEVLLGRSPAILVTDVVMAGISGIELAQRCSHRYPDIPVLLVSGFIPERELPQLDDGTWSRLDKPVRSARLVATVGRLCRRAERAARGNAEITDVKALFPPLAALSSAQLDLPQGWKRATP